MLKIDDLANFARMQRNHMRKKYNIECGEPRWNLAEITRCNPLFHNPFEKRDDIRDSTKDIGARLGWQESHFAIKQSDLPSKPIGNAAIAREAGFQRLPWGIWHENGFG